MYTIYKAVNYSKQSYPDAVERLFCTNGISMNSRGWIDNYSDNYCITEYPEPEPLTFLCPWYENEKYQTFRKYAGCRDIGFKETVEYFLACLELTEELWIGHGDNKQRVDLEWKENIETIRSVLLDTPTIEDRYTIDDLDKFLEDVKDDTVTDNHGGASEETPNSIKQVYLFDVQWSDCPEAVEVEVKELWRDREFGNNDYYAKETVDVELFERYPMIYFWLKHKGLEEGQELLIHWWW